jgi:hypothetical protein
MSASKIPLRVKAEDADTELFLVDCDLQLVLDEKGEKRGFGSKTWEVEPGPYKVKARRGTAIREALVLVRPGMGTFTVPGIPFASPNPLAGTAWTHEHHIAADHDAATRAPDVTHGAGSAIVIVAREWTEQSPSPQVSGVDPSRGLSLLTLEGALVANLEQSSSKDLGWQPCVTCHIAVAPGAYRLRLNRPDGCSVEMSIVASPGWQTHVYLLTEMGVDPALRCVDVVNGAISLRRREDWDRSHELRELWQLEDLARNALLDDRTKLARVLERRIDRKVPPMLALYGAYVLINEARRSREEHPGADPAPKVHHERVVARIVERLREMLGPEPHPDVEALALGAGVANPEYRFTAPPMLRASWQRILSESVRDETICVPGSFAQSIAGRLWGDGPGLIWSVPDAADGYDPDAAWTERAAQLLAEFLHKTEGTPETPETSAPHLSRTWTDAFRGYVQDLKDRFARPSLSGFPEHAASPVASAAPAGIDTTRARELLANPEFRKELVREIGLPMGTIRQWLEKAGPESDPS